MNPYTATPSLLKQAVHPNQLASAGLAYQPLASACGVRWASNNRSP